MILHVMILDKFLPPFIDFVDKNFGRGEHKYVFITSERYIFGLTPEHDVDFLNTDEDIFITLLIYMRKARKIILHGLWRSKVNKLLLSDESILNKTYWFMWGGDYYNPQRFDQEHHEVICNVPYKVSFMEEAFDTLKRLYPMCRGVFLNSALYPSNSIGSLTDKSEEKKIYHDGVVNVLLGHSGVEDNQHKKYIDFLKDFDNLSVFCPLSYPSINDYVKDVISYGEKVLGQRFNAIVDFMEPELYQKNILNNIDIAVLGSWRTHGMGTLIKLILGGAKVFLDENIHSYSWLKRNGFFVYSLREIDFSILPPEQAIVNKEKAQQLFCKEALARSLERIFNN